jgi:NitT/TauT family transport system substrate-binding protein
MNRLRSSAALVLVAALIAGCERGPSAPAAGAKAVVRVGHFPNVTHVQALVARALLRAGRGWFEERLGPGVEVQWFVYNAGPSAMEAIFAGSLDLTYVGPNPALNAYIRSEGEEIRVIAGAAVGGAALVVQGDGSLREPADFKGKRIGTPQLGNTQDVACRAWLKAGGLRVPQLGGDADVVPAANADLLALFQQKSIDAAWTVEPWVSRLEEECGGKVLVEENDAVTTLLVARARFLREHRDIALKFAAAHAELTGWIEDNPAEAQRLVSEELQAETTRPIPGSILERSWKRLRLTTAIRREALDQLVESARRVGFLEDKVDLSRLVEPLQ